MRGGGGVVFLYFYLCFVLFCFIVVLALSFGQLALFGGEECILSAPQGTLIFLLNMHFTVDRTQE